MNRSSAQRNINSLILISERLDELCNEVTFVGGCIMDFLITDKAAPDVRFTMDKDRGNQDFLLSHDLEDIIAVIDGRPEIVNEILNAAQNLKDYLADQFNMLLNNSRFMQALPGHLNYSSESEERSRIVESRINEIIKLGR